jgi:hypothetical protein
MSQGQVAALNVARADLPRHTAYCIALCRDYGRRLYCLEVSFTARCVTE